MFYFCVILHIKNLLASSSDTKKRPVAFIFIVDYYSLARSHSHKVVIVSDRSKTTCCSRIKTCTQKGTNEKDKNVNFLQYDWTEKRYYLL